MPSVREQIIVRIAAALNTISIANGYENDIVGGVHRLKQGIVGEYEMPYIEVGLFRESKRPRNINQYETQLTVSIHIAAVHDEAANPGPADAYLDTLMSDVERALYSVMADPPFLDFDQTLSWESRDEKTGQEHLGLVAFYESTYSQRLSDPSQVA